MDLGKIKKFSLAAIIFLLIVVIVVALWFNLEAKKPIEKKTQVSKGKTYGTLTLPDRREVPQQLLSQLKKEVPYKTDEFEVAYSEQSDVFGVTILKEPVRPVAEKAVAWFKGKGGDICSLNVIWTASKQIQLSGNFKSSDTVFCQ